MKNLHSTHIVSILALASVVAAPAAMPQIWLKTESPYAADTKREALVDEVEQTKTIFKQLDDWDLSLTRASEGKAVGQPAAFSYIRSFDTENGEEDDFTADFFLNWTPMSKDGYTYSLSVEGHLGGENGQAEDAWRFRATVEEDHNGIFGLDSYYGSYSFKYETDKNFDASKLIGEFLFTGSDEEVLMGKGEKIGTFAGKPVVFTWEPAIGLDIGYNADPGDSNEVEDTILRLVGTVSVYMPVHAVRDALGVHDFWLYGSAKVRYLPLEKEETAYEFFTLGGEFVINDNVTLGIQYKNGEDAPTFDAIESLGVTLGLTF